MPHKETTGELFERVVAFMARLRGPGGCPWDREQTFDSIKPYTLEETYEVFEAIDKRDWNELPGELGDLLLQVLFYSQIGSEDGTFSIDDVLQALAEKLIGRHPHVFGDVKAENSAQVLKNWDAIKVQEKKAKSESTEPTSILAGVSSAMPSFLEAGKISSRAAKVGFDWPNAEAVLDKVQEEVTELRAELTLASKEKDNGKKLSDKSRAPLEEELGDLLFALVNLARHLSIDPESSLKQANRKFRRRFAQVEFQLRKDGKALEETSLDVLEQAWQAVKKNEEVG
jgi:MazG family protein